MAGFEVCSNKAGLPTRQSRQLPQGPLKAQVLLSGCGNSINFTSIKITSFIANRSNKMVQIRLLIETAKAQACILPNFEHLVSGALAKIL